VDDGERLPEIDLVSTLACFDAPMIIVGDPQQQRRIINFDENNEHQSGNLMAPQMSYSTIERAVDAGATDSYLRLNHRSYGDLSDMTSKRIYRRLMMPYRRDEKQWPTAAIAFNRFLRHICPTLPLMEQNRIMVTFPGSWVSHVGGSARNIAHARWIVRQAIKAIKDKGLTSVDEVWSTS
jgi:hypothetical protein